MKRFFKMMLPALVLMACSEEGGSLVGIDPDSTQQNEEVVAHEMMVLGKKLENPYSLSNVSEAVSALYPTRGQLSETDLYVRFLPKTQEEYNRLSEMGVEMVDYPVDYEIIKDGDYYRDPSIDAGRMSWQYAVVPADFEFPDGIEREVLDKCFIPDESSQTRGFEDVDWEAVEKESFRLTGNETLLSPSTRGKVHPSGRITIKDEGFGGGNVVGVSGVKVVANCFVKISTTYTDKEGNYEMSKKFSSRPHYRLCFKNTQGFSLGLNLILIPASISTLGKGDPDGMDYTVDKNSDDALFRRCVVNNAAYDYFTYCKANSVACPPSNLRIWILDILRPSCAVMLHHGALLDNDLVSNYLGVYKIVLRVFAPDITIGSRKIGYDYASLYSITTHEMAHASHFSKAGTTFWKNYAKYILSSFLTTGSCYGTGNGEDAGYCEVGEMWGYYVQNKLFKDRYGCDPFYGTDSWFYPQALTALDDGGMTMSEICSALTSAVTDRDIFRERLTEIRSDKKSLIVKTFSKYAR